MTRYVIPFNELRMSDVEKVGGKNASLGEMIRHLGAAGVRVPGGFAVTSAAYWHVVDDQGVGASKGLTQGVEQHRFMPRRMQSA